MDIIEKILKFDNEFIKLDNQYIIDNELKLFQKFENSRNELINHLSEVFKGNTYTDEEKIAMLKKLEESNHKIECKFNSIKSLIKSNNLKTHQFKGAYQYAPNIDGSFFINKSI